MPTRSGVRINHTFAAPGLVNVTLQATDAEGLNATLTQAVPVDDFVTLRFEFVNPPDSNSPGFAYVRATDWEGNGIPGADVHIVVRYQADPRLPLMETQNFHVTTEANGEKHFPLPRDSFLGNHPGRHYADATLTVQDTVLGDAEQATARITYWIDDPSLLP